MLARSLLSSSNVEEVRIFYSYSRKDSTFRSLIDNVLGKFKWDVEVRTWYDGDIQPGEDWTSEINDNLNAADIVLLFITQQFIDSDYCMHVELPQALENHNSRDCRVIPMIIEETTPDWRTLPFAHLQVLPQNGQPLSQWSEIDEAVRNIVQGIVDIIATANMDPKGRCRWQLHLAAAKANFGLNDELQMVRRLREISKDGTLRPRAIGEGSVVALLESTKEGLRRVKRWFAEGESVELAGYPVKRIVELFGAGLHASVYSATGLQSNEQVPDPDPDLLLFPSNPFFPPLVASIVLRKNCPSKIDFIITRGEDNLQGEAFEEESKKLSSYFYTALAAPDDDIFVNLAPDESNRMLGPYLEGTALGRAMLEEDYRLKRLSASLLHPDSESGREFWQRVFEQARAERGTASAIYNTFQRVWIVPDEAVVYVGALNKDIPSAPPLEDGETQVSVSELYLRVKCQHEYLSGYSNGTPAEARWAKDICSPIFKDLIVPLIEGEVNEGKNFAGLRQIYCSMVLAEWCKKEYRDDPKWAQWFNPENRIAATIRGITPYFEESGSVCTRDAKSAPSHTPSNDNAGKKTKLPPRMSDEYSKLVSQATFLRKSGELVKSRELLENAVNGRTELYGAKHQLTLVATDQLGRTMRDMGQLDEARRLHEMVLATRSQTLGSDHDYTVNSMNILAETLLEIGEVTAACELQAQAAEIRMRKSSAYSIPENREYFEKYLRIFREGVFHIVRDEYDPRSSSRETRTYFAGAIDFREIPLNVLRRSFFEQSTAITCFRGVGKLVARHLTKVCNE
jgi:TIR domain/Tetratricopeptide repeat